MHLQQQHQSLEIYGARICSYGDSLGSNFRVLLQFPDSNFLEKHYVIVTMVLQTDIAFERSASTLWLEIELFLGHWTAFGVVRNLHAVQNNDGMWPLQCNFHGVPLWARFSRLSQWFCERVQGTCDVVLIFIRRFWAVINLHFVPVVHGHPLFSWFYRNT